MISTKIYLIILIALVSSSFYAEGKKVNPKNVLSVVTTDWNNDGGFDRAVLVINGAEPTQTELFIYLSDSTTSSMKLMVHKKDVAWRGVMWGTQPWIELTPQNSLTIHSLNEAIGRNRWEQVLTVAYRNDEFMVVGYTYGARDTLDLDYNLNCDVNLLTGNGIKNGESFSTSPKAIPLASWSDDLIPENCQ